MPVKYEMLYVGQWKMNLLLADRYGEDRVFLAGDAVHLVIPTGGLGMNTGVGDASMCRGSSRRRSRDGAGPICSPPTRSSAGKWAGATWQRPALRRAGAGDGAPLYRPEIREPTAAGAALRQELARVADVEQHKATEMIGAELGYRYVGSPLIATEAREGPKHDFMTYVATTWPGARLPHVWLNDRSAMQDRIGYGHGYTLLRLGGTKAEASAFATGVRRHWRAVAGSRYCG
jgi:hypothetical protein